MADCDCGLCAGCNGQAVVWRTEAPPEAGWYHCIFIDSFAGRPWCFPTYVREGGDTTIGRPVLYGPPILPPDGWRSALLALEGVSYG